MEQVELTQVPDERVMTRVFRGYSRFRATAPSKAGYTVIDMADCMNMASEQYPCAWVRAPRVAQHNYVGNTEEELKYAPAKALDCVWIDGKIAYLLANGTVMCGMNRWKNGDRNLTEGRLFTFGLGLFVPCCNMYIPSVLENTYHIMEGEYLANVKVSPSDLDGTDYPASATAPQNPAEGDYWYCTTAGDTYGVGLYQWVITSGTGAWEAQTIYYSKIKPVIGSPSDLGLYINAVLRFFLYKTGATVTITSKDDDYDSIGTVTVRARPEIHLTESATAPANPSDGDYWYDTVHEEFYKYVAASSQWTANTPTAYIIVNGDFTPIDSVKVKVNSLIPKFDYAVPCNNRMWACRYGENNDGAFVNEIYASCLGDPTNWMRLDGLADDAFVAGVGETGNWTGAAVVGDNVVFMKEHCMYTVYGETPSSYTVKMEYCSGVQKGSEKSVARIGVFTYYNSPHGIMRVASGSLPTCISDDLMYKQVLTEAVAGTDGRKYYMQARRNVTKEDTSPYSKKYLYVYDTELNEWHIENEAEGAVAFLPQNNNLLAVCRSKEAEKECVDLVYVSPPEDILQVFSLLYLCRATESGIKYPDEYINDTGTLEEGQIRTEDISKIATFENISDLAWHFVTGNFGLNEPDYKRVKSIAVRAWLDKYASFQTEIMYDDDGEWHLLEASKTFVGGETGTNRVEYRLRRCDLYRLRISGTGRACIYSITHTYEGDGNRAYGSDSV